MMGRFNFTMKKNPFQHIDLRVNNLEEAWAFYSKKLPTIGFEKDCPASVAAL
jgi:predicted enzyme related to lactoylglutathione lyase